MKLTPIAVATCSAVLLLAACGETETVEETPPADGPIESEGSLTEDPEIGLNEEPGGEMSAETDMSGDMAEEENSTLASLEGDWVSGDDDKSEMSIIDGTVTMMYDGEVLSTDTLEVVDSCPDVAGEVSDMQLITMTSNDTDESLCYGIITLNDERLELSSYPRGNTLTYERMPVGSAIDTE
ncbi:hypothetical protein [Henriciella marina]|uniref:hypothetical protein n=1 Tax=Henriciella marina TaxID=453851 RepID=UPI00037B3B29|nr:hypothetical protein [Henriciella marina]